MILLSFDVEEFDMPFEYGKSISFEEQISISKAGTTIVLDLLKSHQIKATFFCTAQFANHAPHLIERMINEGHEVASHGYYHSEFKSEHLLQSRKALEKITKEPVIGFRMARMMPVDEQEIAEAGYTYNTSINPTYIPGRYNNFSKPRTYFVQKGVLQIPASVSPMIRIPLFWLAFHNFPLAIYKQLCRWTYSADKYLNLYFHPWEFTDLNKPDQFGFPSYVSKNTGDKMIYRLNNLIQWMVKQGYTFGTFKDFISTINRQ
jgi:peptidoglycan/xylan/chitin deacetylase (PgdA/CDA1 family)